MGNIRDLYKSRSGAVYSVMRSEIPDAEGRPFGIWCWIPRKGLWHELPGERHGSFADAEARLAQLADINGWKSLKATILTKIRRAPHAAAAV
jgi:hypothetical protein